MNKLIKFKNCFKYFNKIKVYKFNIIKKEKNKFIINFIKDLNFI
jgi:hypothetical protein